MTPGKPVYGLDYAAGRPGGAAIAAAGFSFAVRYLTDGGPGLPGKLLTRTEYADLQAHGIGVVVNWETTADRMRSGWAAGRADATSAHQVATTVGHPADKPIYFSADWDATPDDQVSIDAYLRGAATVLKIKRIGIYGSYYVVKRCLDAGTATWGWQACAWSGGQRLDTAHLYQHVGTVIVGGVECDRNEALQLDFGQHPYATHRKRHSMNQLPATPMPKDPNSPPLTWAQTNYTIGFDTSGGWEGGLRCEFGVQEFAGRPSTGIGGLLRLASWEMSDGTLVPVSTELSTTGDPKRDLAESRTGVIVVVHKALPAMTAPNGAVALTLNYAAPGGAYVTEGRSA